MYLFLPRALGVRRVTLVCLDHKDLKDNRYEKMHRGKYMLRNVLGDKYLVTLKVNDSNFARDCNVNKFV